MSPFFPFRPRIRALFLTAISVLLVSISLAWASRQQAGSPSFKSARNHSFITPDAATITVNSLSDVANASDGLCTLREAVTAANNNVASGAAVGECAAGGSSGSDTIDLTAIAGTITLTSALPDLTTDMTLNGPGATMLTVSGQQRCPRLSYPVWQHCDNRESNGRQRCSRQLACRSRHSKQRQPFADEL